MDSTFTPSRRSFQGSMLLLIWITVPTGIFLILNQEFLWGFVLSVLGLATLVVILSPRFAESLEDREIPKNRGFLMAFGIGAAAASTALFVFLLMQPSTDLMVIGSVYALGILGLGAWTVTQVLGSMRS